VNDCSVGARLLKMGDLAANQAVARRGDASVLSHDAHQHSVDLPGRWPKGPIVGGAVLADGAIVEVYSNRRHNQVRP
jgi:hypothetical protein